MVDGLPAEPLQLSDAKKEQIKLRATFLNNIGIGVILIGVATQSSEQCMNLLQCQAI